MNECDLALHDCGCEAGTSGCIPTCTNVVDVGYTCSCGNTGFTLAVDGVTCIGAYTKGVISSGGFHWWSFSVVFSHGRMNEGKAPW